MRPQLLGEKYNKIAEWWNEQHQHSDYGISQVERAIKFCTHKGSTLDVGCGSGGRIIRTLTANGFKVTGLDVSSKMIDLARTNHPQVEFHQADIVQWQPASAYDLIIAWDSIFHLPIDAQAPVVTKLCSALQPGGILIYTFGDDYGEHQSHWHDDTFHYSTIGINENLRLLMENQCQLRHLELDQYPEKHVVVIAERQGN